MDGSMARPALHKYFGQRVLPRLILFELLWLVLAGTSPQSIMISLPVVIVATIASLILAPTLRYPISPLPLIRSLPLFLFLSLVSGFDVMKRVFHPDLPIRPGLISYHTRLPHGPPLALLLNCISLLPGTISADYRDSCILVHTIDTEQPAEKVIKKLEDRIGEIFRVDPASGGAL
ncbi:MAG: Na+/H+ antiporter subunit E [Proteobacteria bacterium]|nr:Na+/H+ antiporter subunit E [Pseudomonadota bacterium]MBU1686920.1 Na+/H+ antiporter subunit E [Pseudomonadota bacterium]